jgi:hypothetical protein
MIERAVVTVGEAFLRRIGHDHDVPVGPMVNIENFHTHDGDDPHRDMSQRGASPAEESHPPGPPSAGRSNVPGTVTRVVLVHGDSGYTEKWAESWDIHVQDAGRTLKLFPRKPTEPRYAHTPGFFETGLDMGARLDGAAATYPQHTKHQK